MKKTILFLIIPFFLKGAELTQRRITQESPEGEPHQVLYSLMDPGDIISFILRSKINNGAEVDRLPALNWSTSRHGDPIVLSCDEEVKFWHIVISNQTTEDAFGELVEGEITSSCEEDSASPGSGVAGFVSVSDDTFQYQLNQGGLKINPPESEVIADEWLRIEAMDLNDDPVLVKWSSEPEERGNVLYRTQDETDPIGDTLSSNVYFRSDFPQLYQISGVKNESAIELSGIANVNVNTISIEWVKYDEGYLDLDENMLPYTNHVVGKRIFPGAIEAGEGYKDRIRLRIKTSNPNALLHVKLFDVDDPFPNERDPGNIVDENDSERKGVGNDNQSAGYCFNHVLSGIVMQHTFTDANGDAELVVFTSTFPGDNCRAVASFSLTALNEYYQVEDRTESWYVGVDNYISNASELLTTWRKLHVEQDTMKAKNVTELENVELVDIVYRGEFHGGHNYDFKIRCNGEDELPSNYFSGGFIKIGEEEFEIRFDSLILGDFRDRRITVKGGGVHDFVTNGGVAVGDIVGLVDDDDLQLPDEYKLPFNYADNFITDWVKNAYKPVCIDVVRNENNENKEVDFMLNADPPFSQSRDSVSTQSFWSCRLVAAYQMSEEFDGDPDSEVPPVGAAYTSLLTNSGDIGIYLEALRDYNFYENGFNRTNEQILQSMMDWRNFVVAHEIGHVPLGSQSEEDQHEEGGIMDPDSSEDERYFFPETIKRMRSVSNWRQYWNF